jgi:hypothetical protein
MGKLLQSWMVLALAFPLVFPHLQRTYTGPEIPPALPSRKTYKFINGQWFDGKKFERRVFYSVGGVLTQKQLRAIDEVIDLQSGYVVPPFGEAHNHNIESPNRIEYFARQYLRDGIFYVKNPNNIRRVALQIKEKINTPTSIDVVFAHGGLTATGGHPVKSFEERKGFYKAFGVEDFENEGYFLIDNANDLQSKWAKIIAGQPDFIKTYLLYSEQFEERRDDPKFDGWKGLDPKLLPHIVEQAHNSGLRVSTHVETATDFHNAITRDRGSAGAVSSV